jgi:hypothetical protein
MTTIDLARRAIACPGWRWMPGMLALDTGLRLDEMTDDWEAELPDFSDPATLGCLLALVREAWDDPHVYVAPDGEDEPWVCHVRISASCSGIEAATEADALLWGLLEAGRW